MTIRIDGTNTAANPGITGADADTGLQFGTDIVNIVTGGTTRATVDSNGNLGVGTTPEAWSGFTALEVSEASIVSSGSGDAFFAANAYYDGAWKYKDAGVARNIYMNSDGIVFRQAASGSADGAITWSENARIDSSGYLIGGGSTDTNPSGNNAQNVYAIGEGRARFSSDLAAPLGLNRKGNDGTIAFIYQDGNSEGTISVSGSTVSYNGAHLARWSQLPGGTERTEILRGSVLSNIDEMCEWGEEDNEQLNRMKVSDVEGDKNVSGVFQAWDDDDDTYTNDFYCAMTGDFIIRIAQGVTVERGDLLMSAGDGTAKPQDDDIIRSKTIAKVTSTNVSCTYDDGSYCVPCVLMAC